jgi:hypothetical protein
MDKIIYGADTETYKGKPLTLQFYSEDIACDECHFVTPENATSTFMKWCATRKRDVLHVVYIHNLEFDLTELLWTHYRKLVENAGEFEFKAGKFLIKGCFGTPTFCTISNGHDITIKLVDSYSFFRGSLLKMGGLVCPDLPKLKRPDGLGDKKFTRRSAGFVDYAMRDAVIAYHMGRAIEAMHQEFQVAQAVSIADMSAKIFRKMLTYKIYQPSREVTEHAMLSYHGGKNNITVAPGWYEGVASEDISSAYPDAMMDLPAFSNRKLYRKIVCTNRVKKVPEFGVYCISGEVAECKYPVLFSHGFKPLSGRINRVWVQGYELNEALRSGEFKPSKVSGHFYEAERDHQAPAFRHFVETFYRKKETATDKVYRTEYKFILNSLSGKFVQTRKRGTAMMTDIDAGQTVSASDLVAGGLFHPFIASAITAHTRARIHRLEHDFKAIHTATDGIMTLKRPKAVGKGIGALTVEAKDATLLLIRNKLYILYAKKSKDTTPSLVFKGKHILKYALHGFQGSVTDLERLIARNKRECTVNKPLKLKTAIKTRRTPNLFVKKSMQLRGIAKIGVMTS